MQFNDRNTLEKLGEKTGFIFSYFLFTTAMYYILFFTNKLPDYFSYFHIMSITALIVLIGYSIDYFLK